MHAFVACWFLFSTQDADLTLAPPGSPITVLGMFSIAASGSKVAVQTESVRAIGATSSFSNGTYPEGSVIPVTVMFSVEVRVQKRQDKCNVNVAIFLRPSEQGPWELESGGGTLNIDFNVKQTDEY